MNETPHNEMNAFRLALLGAFTRFLMRTSIQDPVLVTVWRQMFEERSFQPGFENLQRWLEGVQELAPTLGEELDNLEVLRAFNDDVIDIMGEAQERSNFVPTEPVQERLTPEGEFDEEKQRVITVTAENLNKLALYLFS